MQQDLPPPVVGDWAEGFDGPERGLDPNAHRILLDEYAMRCCRAGYYGLINFVDDQIGRLLHYAQRDLNNTFILFTSDHGEMLGDHHLFRKTFPYEASARIPFLVRPPLTTAPPLLADLSHELVVGSPVGLQDVMPTLLDVAGVDVPPTCTGRSVLPLMRGEVDGWRDAIHGEHAACYAPDDAYHYLVDSQHKYIWNATTGREQLFDLREDPNELRDLAMQPQSDSKLQPWRSKLVEILKDRPEGFVQDGCLTPDRPYSSLIPGYEPDTMYPFL